ncbi:MAG: hypothetical protein JNJ59_05395 [Deltaproteobacteria bacterium]|nr:hypothetical protein [Deltaproteobacteria bacterium]
MMAKATIQYVQTQSDKLHGRWTREFAGKPRHTRDLGELERLIEKTAVLAKKAKGIPGEKGDAVEKVVLERLKLYRDERDSIAEAQYDRPEVGEIHQLGIAVDRAMATWRRHFAGRDRRTRDLVRLDDLLASLGRAVPRLTELAETHPEVKKENLESLAGQLEVFKDERDEIVKLRKAAEPATRAAMLLAEAQSTLDRYRVHFAGQPRATCSLALLDRLLGALRATKAQIIELDLGDSQTENLNVLTQHITAWETERPLIAKAREEIQARDLTNQLGLVANKLFQIYQQQFAGQDRATRNLQLLSDVCDRLGDVSDQMAAHDLTSAEKINRKNTPLVEDRVRRYETEWIEIAKVKAQIAEQQARQAGQPGQPAKGQPPTRPIPMPGITIAEKK